MDLQLKNRTCLVTGASRGIGRGIAKVLAAEGGRVAIVARRASLLNELADEIEAAGHARPLVLAEDLTAGGVMERIRVPFLVTHGAKDRQIALDYARQSYDQLVNCPARELKVFTGREGGVEHVGADNMSYARDFIADWFGEVLGGSTG